MLYFPVFVLLMGCSKFETCPENDFSIEKGDNGDCSINGYFYGDDTTSQNTSIFYFYENGLVLRGPSENLKDAMSGELKNSSLDVSKIKANWGIFNIKGDCFQMELFEPTYGRYEKFARCSGTVLNNSCLRLNSYELLEKGEVVYSKMVNGNLLFVQASFKPDSVNPFIN